MSLSRELFEHRYAKIALGLVLGSPDLCEVAVLTPEAESIVLSWALDKCSDVPAALTCPGGSIGLLLVDGRITDTLVRITRIEVAHVRWQHPDNQAVGSLEALASLACCTSATVCENQIDLEDLFAGLEVGLTQHIDMPSGSSYWTWWAKATELALGDWNPHPEQRVHMSYEAALGDCMIACAYIHSLSEMALGFPEFGRRRNTRVARIKTALNLVHP